MIHTRGGRETWEIVLYEGGFKLHIRARPTCDQSDFRLTYVVKMVTYLIN